ncbi:olfactory receptor 10G9-like [Ursus maritimus]|uniref:Olfactory receptor 10G9-like n=1 Tax=Ursus maritimus TaxID=29073 RepID=A0A384C0H6_URSMA|nr:olfactory receptor 10G9-like [Ursus maritimus]
MTHMSVVTTFFFMGLPRAPALDIPLLGLFLVIYVLTVVGNLLILLVIMVDSHLHTPMYYFLTNLSFIDMWFSTVTVPKMLMTLASPGGRAISFHSCVAQLYSFHFLGSTECFLYTVMSYDRYLAISHPLRYTSMMSGRTCALLATSTWLSGSLHSAVQTTLTFCLPYCGPIWPWSFHLPEARLPGCCGWGCGSFLHGADAPSKPGGVHPEEQGSEESSAQGNIIGPSLQCGCSCRRAGWSLVQLNFQDPKTVGAGAPWADDQPPPAVVKECSDEWFGAN